MKYREIKIHTTESGADILTSELLGIGIDGIIVDSPNLVDDILNQEEYMWNYIDEALMNAGSESDIEKKAMDEVIISFYLDMNDDTEEIYEKLEKIIVELKEKDKQQFYANTPVLGTLSIESETVSDEKWKDKWKDYFKPAKITENIVIKPTWETYEAKKDEIIIEIDPGMAFGTGTHETTSMVIELMEKYIKKGDKFLDVGSGSGILSIAAAHLGAGEIYAVDIDPVACEVSKENVEINGFTDKVKVECRDLTKGLDYVADIVCANLVAELVIYLSGYVMKNLESGGVFISSGILMEKKETVVTALCKNGYEILEIIEKGEWCAIAATYES